MTAIILALPSETSQERANRLLADWQEQRRAGIKPADRTVADDQFSRDLEVLRQLLARS